MAKHDDVKEDKAMISKAVHKHETHMHKGHGLTKLSGGGIYSIIKTSNDHECAIGYYGGLSFI